MDTAGERDALASFLATQDALTLAQVLLELAEDFAPFYERLERLRLRDDPAQLCARFKWQLQQWDSDDRFVGHRDAAKFGRDLDTWVSQVEREVLPRYPIEAMALFTAFLEMDRVIYERVDDDGGYVGGAFKVACRLWLTAAEDAGLTAAEISGRLSAIVADDNYGARSDLASTVPR